MKIKPGYRTSEFWFTLVSFIFSGLYLTGLINDNTQKEELISTVSHAVESCILIGGQLVILYRYINARSEIKKEYPTPPPIETPVTIEPKPLPPPEESKNTKPKERKKNDKSNNKSRTNKTRSRKTNSKKQNKSK